MLARCLRGLLPLALLVLSACSNAVVLNPRGTVGQSERTLIITAFALMLVVVIPVIVMTVVFARRYRASNEKARYEPEWAHSRRLEAVVWLVPVALIAVLATISWITTHSLDPFRPLAGTQKTVEIQVVSMDWKWLFIYPDEGVAAVNEVALPVGVPVHFSLTSDTVMTSFFIPQLGSQIYTMAGMKTQLNLVADQQGSYAGIAANFSGPGFSGMTFTARALSREQFDGWIGAARASSATLDPAAYAALARPSANNPVRYYSAVSPGLFERVLGEYRASPQAARE